MPRTVCPLDCPDSCSLEVTVVDGMITKVDAAPGNPLTEGYICQKVKHHGERVHGPDRVLTPLVRTGPKGDGSFRPASWDDALDLVVAAVQRAVAEHGPASVVPYLYNSSGGVLAASGLGPRLWRRVGASDVIHTICALTAGTAYRQIYGAMLPADPFDVEQARLIVVWGANPTVANIHFAPMVQRAQKAGARLVVVDPRRTAIAARADRHLAVRPATDVVLALAMARHMHANGLLARDFLGQHATGLDEHLAAAEPWTLDRAADVCGVPANDIAATAEEYATTRPAFLRMGWGLERNRNGGSSCLAVLALPVLAGQFGVEGSGVMTSLSRGAPVSVTRGDPDASLAWPARREVNMNLLGHLLCGELDGPPASVLFVQGANPAAMNPDQVRVRRGLARDDLFTVVHEQVMTDTAHYADVVLPATTHFEVDDLAVGYGAYVTHRIRPVIPRVGESRTNDEVSAAIAVRLGYPADVFDPDPSRLLEQMVLSDEPLDGRVTRAAGATVGFRDVFPTHGDRRAHLHDPDSNRPVPAYAELASAFPLTLVSPSTHRTINSMLGELNGAPAVISLHPDDAAARNIMEGGRVRVENEQASIELPARIDRDLRPGVCVIPKGLWSRHVEGGLTANALTPATLSDLADGACFNDALVEVVALG
jgi:anaerobic selenocysteine-containing dehydrogenase